MIKSSDLHGLKSAIRFPELPVLPYEKSCITIGNFDGVHLGHQAIISKMVRRANARGNPLIVITLFPNPYDFFNPDIRSFYLSTPKEKEQRLLDLGVDRVLSFQFDREFANLSPQEFLSALKDKLGVSTLVVGEDFALGKNRAGTPPVLKDIGKSLNFKVKVLSQVTIWDKEISSTRVRKLLDEGKVRAAASLLGRYYSLSGLVTYGSSRGSKIGLPTANIDYWKKKKLPAVGVYATKARINQEDYEGITNVGYRPTFEIQDEPNIETYIFDFSENIYEEKFELAFVEKIRDEQKFSGVEDLLAQIEKDKQTARRIFENEQK
jgi:riboflavin kinase/FMN adenylyltransferase